jgi:Family of unknown function (DUF5995)
MPRCRAVHRDYQRVDALLATVETHIAGWFDTGLIADIEDVTPQKTDEAIAMWSLAGARDVAWDHAQVLWALRDSGLIRARTWPRWPARPSSPRGQCWSSGEAATCPRGGCATERHERDGLERQPSEP